MEIKDLVIDVKRTVGDDLVLVDVAPVFVYEDGKRTDKIIGYRYVVSMPLTQDSEGNYIIPIKGDSIELVRYGQTLLLEVNNAEPSQLQGISVYCTRNKW